MTTLWIGLGGALGAIARYHLDRWLQVRAGSTFPIGIVAVNVLGSFALAFLLGTGARFEALPREARLALSVGLLGGFTTYSTFNQATLRYVQSGAHLGALLHVFATVIGCLVAGAAGWWLGRRVGSSG